MTEPTDAQMADYLLLLRTKIDKYGWAVQGVFGGGEHPYVYTVGLYPKFGWELILFGLDPQVGASIINNLAHRIRAGQEIVAHGAEIDGILTNAIPIMLLEVAGTDRMNAVNALYDVTSCPAWQIVYPDRKGLWPWENRSLVDDMPLLAEHP